MAHHAAAALSVAGPHASPGPGTDRFGARRSYFRILAARVAEVRWGPAYEELVERSGPDVAAAIGYFSRLGQLLAAP